MGCIITLFKVAAGLIGMVLMLGGFVGFVYGIMQVLTAMGGGSPETMGEGIILIVGGIIVCTIATYLGKFSRGDYDRA